MEGKTSRSLVERARAIILGSMAVLFAGRTVE